MAQRPPRDLDWISDDATGITVPSGAKQAAGWLIEKPARQFFNWLWNRCSRWFHYLSGQSQEFIIIDSTNANEKDYDTLVAYLADSPSAGDKVLVKETQAVTAQLAIPSDIEIRFLKGVKITTATNMTTLFRLADRILIKGSLVLELSHTGTITNVILFDGDDSYIQNAEVKNLSTGTISNAYKIQANKDANFCRGLVSGSGTLTNALNDASTRLTNDFVIRDDINNTIWGGAFPVMPSFSVHKNGTAQTNITGTQKITWSTEEFDTNNNFASDRFTPTVKGKYLLIAALRLTSAVAGDTIIFHIYKNGAIYKSDEKDVLSGETRLELKVDALVDANGTSDYFEVFASNVDRDTSDADGATNSTYFQGSRIS